MVMFVFVDLFVCFCGWAMYMHTQAHIQKIECNYSTYWSGNKGVIWNNDSRRGFNFRKNSLSVRASHTQKGVDPFDIN